MTILNLMLGKQRGGLEQAAIDYAEALALAEIPALTVLAPAAWAEAPLVSAGLPHEALANYGGWDYLAALRLRRLAQRVGARAVICHGNRAVSLALKALKGRVPIIAVAHNYSIRRFAQVDHGFAITQQLAQKLEAMGLSRVSLMPNMVRLPAPAPRPTYRTPAIIGSMGRFVEKKGFVTYIEALAILAKRGIAFHAILGGTGEQEPLLREMIAQHQLASHITLSGWVRDKSAFFEAIDLFVLPSYHEAFGIVLIEAMAHRLPIVTTNSEGPREIVHDGQEALVVPIREAAALADAIAHLLENPAEAQQLSAAAYLRVTEHYTPQCMATRLQAALSPYLLPPSHEGVQHG